MPDLNELCDPMLAVDGIAPCYDSEIPLRPLTCALTILMPDPSSMVTEFRCLTLSDGGDGTDIGDGCGEGGILLNGGPRNGCQDAFCLSNGWNVSTYQNHPPNACPFYPDGPEGTLVKGCCTPYCDDAHPCEFGWYCQPISSSGHQEPVGYPDVGNCVWNG